jgi:hypothetical protein
MIMDHLLVVDEMRMEKGVLLIGRNHDMDIARGEVGAEDAGPGDVSGRIRR